jgi:hypothetical protein
MTAEERRLPVERLFILSRDSGANSASSYAVVRQLKSTFHG